MQIKINNKSYEAKRAKPSSPSARETESAFPLFARIRIFCRQKAFAGCVWWKRISRNVWSLPACKKSARDWKLQTETEKVNKARKINLELLWADHAGKCASVQKKRTLRASKSGRRI